MIADLLFAGHPLSQAEAARIFGLSRLAARGHLLRLVKFGVAEVATRRKSGQIFVARDGVMTFAVASRPGRANLTQPAPAPLKAVPGRPLTAEERARLEAATDEVALRMGELDRMLARLKQN